jgi:hypothetical protein
MPLVVPATRRSALVLMPRMSSICKKGRFIVKTPNTPAMSRRSLLGRSAAGAVAAAAGGMLARPATAAASAAANARARPAGPGPAASSLADAVFEAFRTHQLVGIGDTETAGVQAAFQEHHDVLQTLLADPRLPEVVDDIVFEYGNALYQDLIDSFVLGDALVNDADLRLVWRNNCESPANTEDPPVVEQVYRRVRAVNWPLPPEKRVRLLAGDPPIDWSNIATAQQVEVFVEQRDTYPASVIEKEVLARGRRALIHYGSAHLTHAVSSASLPPSLVSIVEKQTGVRVYSIADLVPFTGDPGGLGARLASYPRATVIPAAGTWLAGIDAADVLGAVIEQPGKAPVGLYCGIPFGEVLDAGLWLGQPSVLTQSVPNPATYLDPVYWAELQRRNAIMGNQADLQTYRQQQPPQFQNVSPPPCGITS